MVHSAEFEQDSTLHHEGGLGGTVDTHGNGEDSLSLHTKVMEELDGSHRELSTSVHDCGVVTVPAGPVPVVVEPGEGDTELSIGLPVQRNLHGVGGTEVRLGLQPAMYA